MVHFFVEPGVREAVGMTITSPLPTINPPEKGAWLEFMFNCFLTHILGLMGGFSESVCLLVFAVK